LIDPDDIPSKVNGPVIHFTLKLNMKMTKFLTLELRQHELH